ncbi:hypothetical protein FF38_07682 [Lucilia cuprina]|uniref:LRRCT domain-containing protein n=1 Tax=Lucilia cuprina TaxID=7375 RepID=A0A0L0CHV1_LUCCU|nr:SLIT and NTRK-like protein 5 [Lucilia cuprina]KNC31792.1 hypothetical protein FF38_07682 [Lucilia cuprina]
MNVDFKHTIKSKHFNNLKPNHNFDTIWETNLQTTTTIDGKFSTELSESRETENELDQVKNSDMINSIPFLINLPNTLLPNAIGCVEYVENCTLYCIDGSVSYIDDDLDILQSKCNNIDLSLIVEKCEFVSGILQQSFFFGDFSLGYFSIIECNLQTIKAATFKHNNAKNIQTLILRNNQLITLDEGCFDGLTNLVNFEFVQMPVIEVFKGKLFLKPLANSLKKAVIQPAINGSDVMDPLAWWLDLKMISLKNLDLSNTNLQGPLKLNTFQAFESLEYLLLYNCNLHSITAPVFDFIVDTLKYIDLRYNHLQTLDSIFLQKFTLAHIEMVLSPNDWNCECDNEMLQYFIENDSKLAKDIVCKAPEKWLEMELIKVVTECKESDTTTANSNGGTYSMIPPITTTVITTISTTYSTTINYPISTEDTNDATTHPTTSTTPTIGNPTTITPSTTSKIPSYLISLKCYSNIEEEEKTKYVIKPNANFSIFDNSSNSVQINIEVTALLQDFLILYFTNSSDNKTVAETLDKEAVSSNITVIINDLKPSRSYIFCLIKLTAVAISPFDCLGHYIKGSEANTSWLLAPDKVWFITSSTVIALLLFIVAIALVYILLRQNPHWLLQQRNARILPIHNSKRKVLLVSKKSCFGYISPNLSPVSQRSSNYLKSLPPIQETNNYDIENSLYSSKLTAPSVNAPILPPLHQPPKAQISRKCTNTSCTPLNKCRRLPRGSSQNRNYLDVIEDDPEYQTIDHYETVN